MGKPSRFGRGFRSPKSSEATRTVSTTTALWTLCHRRLLFPREPVVIATQRSFLPSRAIRQKGQVVGIQHVTTKPTKITLEALTQLRVPNSRSLHN